MKTNILLTSSFFWLTGFVYSNTYVWEEYDDFSGSTLDTNKWEVGYFSGGQDPVVVNGRVELKGGPYTGTDVTKLPQDLLPISQNSNEGNVFLFIKKDGIQGMEVDITLPSLGNSPGASIGIDVFASNPFSSYGIELGEDESPNWGGVYFYYDYLNPAGNEMEGAKVADWDTTYRVGYLRTEGKTTLLIDGQTVQQFDQSFTSNYWSLNVFNEAGSSFVAYADNVRVLRRSTTTSLDGSTLVLSSTVGVSETLAFENGTFTSTFVDPQEGTIVKTGQNYTLDQITQDTWKITLEDGDTYSFDDSKGTGISEDFTIGNFSGDNSYELISGNLYKDLQGSGVFTFKHYDWEDYDDFSTGSLNASKWGTMNFYGGDKPEVKDGRVEFSSSGKSVSATSDFKQGWNSTEFINYTESAPGSVLYVNDSTVYGMEASITLPVGSSPKTAICLQVGSLNPIGQHIAELMNDSGNGAGFWIHDYVADTGVSTSASSATTFQVAVIHENEKNTFYINSKKVHELDASNFTPDWFGINTFENDGKAYAVYADNVRVLRRSSFSSLIKIAPLAISAFRDQVYLQGQNELVKLDGASEINFDLQLVGKPAVTAATVTVDGVTYDLTSLQAPAQFRTTYGYSIYDDELYDVESSSDSDWSSYVNGKNFSFSFTSEGDSYSYSHDLPPVSALPPIPNTTLAGSPTWNVGSDGNEYQEVEVGSSLTLNWSMFSSADINDFITVSVEELVGDKEIEVMSSTSLSTSTTSYEFPSSLFVSEKKYVLYVAFHKVTQSENPTGFDHQVGTEKTQSLLVTTARSVTAVDVNIVAKTPTTVVSDPNGQAVVMQVGSEYQWNSTLDGVTLWMVHEDDSDDGWFSATVQYVSGMRQGTIGLTAQVGPNLEVNHPYTIDENGMIKVTEDTAFQYYQVTTVENGVIITADDSSFPLSDTSRFFTTRAAAEEYYYSKVNPKDWMWFDNYPWVYSNEMKEWLYFHSSGSKLLYYSNKNKAWREFN